MVFADRMTSTDPVTVRLALTSTFEMIDFVQLVGDHVSRSAGLDDDAIHWLGVALRECVSNAIKHGNKSDKSKQVFVDFETVPRGAATDLRICVRDQGQGFDPDALADPLAPENLLKASGRGIFLIKNFMDDVRLRRVPEGGMEVVMTKRLEPCPPSEPSAPAQ